MRRLLKCVLAAALYYTGLLWLLRVLAAQRGEALIVTYHAVDRDLKGATPAEVQAGLVVTQSTLRNQLRHLAHRYRIVPLHQLARAIASGDRSVGGTCAVTFDDGIEGFPDNAAPVLEELGVPATIFVPTDYLDTAEELPAWRLRRLLWARDESLGVAQSYKLKGREAIGALAAQIEGGLTSVQRALLQSLAPRTVLGSKALQRLAPRTIDIGSHGKSHDPLPCLTEQAQHQELLESKARLEQIAGRPVICCAYPHGAGSEVTARLAASTGYVCACTTRPGSVRPGDDPFLLSRIAADEYASRGILTCYSPSAFEATLRWNARRRQGTAT